MRFVIVATEAGDGGGDWDVEIRDSLIGDAATVRGATRDAARTAAGTWIDARVADKRYQTTDNAAGLSQP